MASGNLMRGSRMFARLKAAPQEEVDDAVENGDGNPSRATPMESAALPTVEITPPHHVVHLCRGASVHHCSGAARHPSFACKQAAFGSTFTSVATFAANAANAVIATSAVAAAQPCITSSELPFAFAAITVASKVTIKAAIFVSVASPRRARMQVRL